jgi:hypothetical protein
LRIRSANRPASCSVSDCEEAFINIETVLVYWQISRYSAAGELDICTGRVLVAKITVVRMPAQPEPTPT